MFEWNFGVRLVHPRRRVKETVSVSEDRTSEGKSAPAFDSSFGQMNFLDCTLNKKTWGNHTPYISWKCS
jgi:hypothetical protein